MSIHESLKHAGFEVGSNVTTHWVSADELSEGHDGQLEGDGRGSSSPAGSGCAA